MTSPRRSVPTQVLVDYVLDPREHTYEEAAAARGGPSRTWSRHWFDRPVVVLGFLVAGFLLAVAYVHTHRGAPEATKVHDDLVKRVRTAQHRDDALASTAQKLNGRIQKVQDAAIGSRLATSLGTEQLLAGQTAVTGAGLQVTLSEPAAPSTASNGSGRGAQNPTEAGQILTDSDVRSVVNELWAEGAEAVAVNGIRLTPTSAIRFAGEAVLVDFQPIQSPYVVTAVGDATTMDTDFASSSVASRYQTLASARGIGFSFTTKSSVRLPGNAGASLRYASVPKPSSTPSGGTK